MTLKLKRGLLSPSAETQPEDFIIVADDYAPAGDDGHFTAPTPMEELAQMEHYARTQQSLQTVAVEDAHVLRLPKGAYVHYIPQYYLH